MPIGNPGQVGLGWLAFALITMLSWGLYGVLLHTGQISMADPINGRYKAFLLVGVAYFLTAVLAPLVVLYLNDASWSFPAKGSIWSCLAGVVGAIGAFFVLMAFAAKGSPHRRDVNRFAALQSSGLPIVTAIVATLSHPPPGGFSSVRWPFVLGILLAALGGCLVTLYRPQA